MFVAVSLAYEATSSDMKILLLDVITNSELKDPPPLWRDPIHDVLRSPDQRVVRQAIRAAVNTDIESFAERRNEMVARDGKSGNHSGSGHRDHSSGTSGGRHRFRRAGAFV